MDKAKAAVSGFLGGKDKHDVSVEEVRAAFSEDPSLGILTVDQHTNPALLNETVHKHQ